MVAYSECGEWVMGRIVKGVLMCDCVEMSSIEKTFRALFLAFFLIFIPLLINHSANYKEAVIIAYIPVITICLLIYFSLIVCLFGGNK